MKKIITLLSFISMPLFAVAQNGDGSSGNPFWGTITTSVQWSTGDPNYGSTVYVGTSSNPDLTISSGGHLTIDPGITVIFTQLTSDLIINGTGILTADGTDSNTITFTKASDKDHWGHISFETPGSTTPISGTGSFSYCIVEFGYAATSGTYPSNAGGGIQVNANDVTITYCIFENNYSNFGAGVTVNAGRNTVIRNSIFKSNTSNQAGGALLLWTNSTARVENCIFDGNNALGNGSTAYGGGAIWLLNNTSTIVNCTFVNNTATDPGDAIYSYSSSGSRIVNSIFWGSNNQFAGAITSSTISNCAFDSVKPSLASNSIVINSINDAPDGPNFVATDGSDWSIKYVSPCRDAGTDSYPGVTIPEFDFVGNSRISTTDIGAFEVQYVLQSIWKTTAGSTNWNDESNWDGGIPSSSSQLIIIPSGAMNYPTGTPAPDFTIGTDNQMILNPGSKVTLGALTNNGTLLLQSDAAGISSLIVSSFSGNDATIDLYLSGGGTKTTYKWHYISSPVSSISADVFTYYTDNLVQWIENLPTGSLSEGWVAYDGWIYSDGAFGGPTFSTLVPGKGYNYYHDYDQLYTFPGQLNTGSVQMTLEYSGTPSLNGFNLLGNPFSSGLDWNYIINDASYPLSTSKGLYFTRDNVQCTYIGGVGIPEDVTGIIPPMQGFFNKTYSTGNTLTLPPAARVQDNIHPGYKGSEIIPLVRLSLQDDTLSDETVVRFDTEAKADLDYDFDALKMFLDPELPYIYSSGDDIKYAINGQPFPVDDEVIEIPFVVNITTDGNHSLTATQVQELDNYNVGLTDKSAGFTIDLKTSPNMSFTASAGIITDRFVLKVSKIATGIENPVNKENNFNIYQSYNLINIRPVADVWNGKTGSVRLLDLAGRSVNDLQNAEFRTNTLLQMPAPETKGIYMVEIRSGAMRHVGKVVIK